MILSCKDNIFVERDTKIDSFSQRGNTLDSGQSPFLRSYSLRKISIAMKKVSSLRDDNYLLLSFFYKYVVPSGTGIIDRGFRTIDNDPKPGNILRVVISRHLQK